ncbi:Cell adhesion molecule 2 [Holothuria leucospilota]|uniref:Cell adhesion molecule 2 n=1 Tax=Holothuria leucospilota TaxID=206669 RepID=A0A9Q1H7G2_HOLLE|nr:Cell adhesion molecule 2 [Holothuria leucospilota]
MTHIFRYSTSSPCVFIDPSSTIPSTHSHFAVLGQNVSLTCRLHPNVEHVVWTHGEEVMITYRRDNSLKSFFRVSPNKTLEIDLQQLQAELTILYAQYNDTGNYSCEQFFKEGTSKASRFYLQLQGYPRLSLETKTSKNSYFVVANCCVEFSWNAKEVFIIWAQQDIIIREGISKPTAQNMRFIDFCDHVDIRSSHNIYGKILTCLVPNKHNLSSWIQMNVTYPATVKILTSTAVKIRKGDEYIISCNSDGNPPPEPKLERKIDNTWRILPITPTAHSNFSTNNITWRFSLAKAYERVDGIYRCTAYNGIGTQSFTESVKVVYRSNRYEWYLDVSRYTRRVSDTLRTFSRSLRPFGNGSNLPDVCYNSATSGEETNTGKIYVGEDY